MRSIVSSIERPSGRSELADFKLLGLLEYHHAPRVDVVSRMFRETQQPVAITRNQEALDSYEVETDNEAKTKIEAVETVAMQPCHQHAWSWF